MVTYRSVFDASAPSSPDGVARVAAGVNVMVAPTRAQAEELFTTAMAADFFPSLYIRDADYNLPVESAGS